MPPKEYQNTAEKLIKLLARDGDHDPKPRALAIIAAVDHAWRMEDQTVSYKLRQRQTVEWDNFSKVMATSRIRTRAVIDDFEKKRKRQGNASAAKQAAKKWKQPIHPSKLPKRAGQMPIIDWGGRIADALIVTLERELGRPLRFSCNTLGEIFGLDLDVLMAIFDVAARESLIIPKRLNGKRHTNPKLAQWFANRIIQRRSHAK